MLDDSDVDFSCGMIAGSGGIISIVILIIVTLVIYAVVSSNKEECSTRSCPSGMTSKLLDHKCLCVGPEATK